MKLKIILKLKKITAINKLLAKLLYPQYYKEFQRLGI